MNAVRLLHTRVAGVVPKVHYRSYLFPLLVLGISVFLLSDYVVPRLQVAFAMLAAPFLFRVYEKGMTSWRYAWLSLLCLVAYSVMQVHILLFFGLGCLLFFTIEMHFGKLGILPLLFLLCLSPALHYIVTSSTFPLRLALSDYTTVLLRSIGYQVENKGSYFVLRDGFTFSVDTACIGLNMFNTGLCLVLLMAGFAEQRSNKRFRWWSLALLLGITVLLLILTNLFRMVTLVFFRSMPDTTSHELIGVLSLILYTALPMYGLVHWLIKRTPAGIAKQTKEIKPSRRKEWMCLLLILGFLAVGVYSRSTWANTQRDEKVERLLLPGFTKTIKEDGVAEFRKQNAIIYIKPATKPFASDHIPAICWQGAGFNLEQFSEENVDGIVVLSGILKRGNVTQYTAWWHDNGADKTSSAWSWRFSRGEPYRIVNITATSKAELHRLCRIFLKQRLF